MLATRLLIGFLITGLLLLSACDRSQQHNDNNGLNGSTPSKALTDQLGAVDADLACKELLRSMSALDNSERASHLAMARSLSEMAIQNDAARWAKLHAAIVEFATRWKATNYRMDIEQVKAMNNVLVECPSADPAR